MYITILIVQLTFFILKGILKTFSYCLSRAYTQTIYISLTHHYIQNVVGISISHAHIYINFITITF